MLSSCQLVLKNSTGSPDEAGSCSFVCFSSQLCTTMQQIVRAYPQNLWSCFKSS